MRLIPRLGLVVLMVSMPVGPVAAVEQAPGARRSVPVDPVTRVTPERTQVPEVLRLLPAAVAEPAALAALEAQPVAPGVPYRNGFARAATEQRVQLARTGTAWTGGPAGALLATAQAAADAGSAPGSTTAWYGRFVVEEAHAFRVLLRDVALPKQAAIWIHAEGVVLGPYGRELLDPEGKMWLPPAPGPEVIVEVVLPAEAEVDTDLGFTFGEVMELVADSQQEIDFEVWTDCDVDATCVSSASLPAITALREAAARLTFVDGGFSYLCSGSLLNDTDASGFRPFLLTANHCFDSQASASSLVAYFDYRSSTCNGAAPSLGSVPSVAGATLRATNPVSDFTFVELAANPSGTTWYLGWTTTDPTSGVGMYRVSHPAGTAQKYSASSYVGSAGVVCGGLPVTDFHYSTAVTGATAGGSSGSPVAALVSGEPYVVGQLLGACHYQSWDSCSYSTYSVVDGAFSTTFPFVESWLDPVIACADAFEPDGSAAQSSLVTAGTPQAHSLCPAGDEDWMRFTLPAQSAVVLETSGASGDTRMWLYDAALAQVEFDDDDGPDLFSRIDRTCGSDPLAAGTYYVKVDEFGDDHEIASYTLSYTSTGPCDGSCAVDITLANATIASTVTHQASNTITLGPALIVEGALSVRAGNGVVISGGTAIRGTLSVHTGPDSCL